jgi:ABC-type Zn uptake system ZnuABC Zn-binding protein ZnuA
MAPASGTLRGEDPDWNEVMMRVILTGLLLAGLAVAEFSSAAAENGDFVGFSEPEELPAATPREQGPVTVVTSTSILADLVQQIGGERVEVDSIAPKNADPHDFEPSPEDVLKIENADLIVLHGLQLDNWAKRLVESADSNAPVIVATKGVKTIGSDEKSFNEGDPHVWFDPRRVKTMVSTISTGLEGVDSAGTENYESRLGAYLNNLDTLDQEIAAGIDTIPPERRKLVTNHDALAYFADRYGLEVIGTVIPGIDSRTEPSAKDVAELIDLIQDEGVSVIFAENIVSPDLAESLAEQAGVEVVPELYTDSLGDEDSGADTYIGLMQTDASLIIEYLSK